MRRIALLVGLASALVLGRAAYAQGPFADVPTDHWAYDAVNQLAAQGIFTGYPDGTFGGKRALTRYEFAVAIQRMLQDVQRRIDAAIAAHEAKPHGAGPTPPPPPPTDLSELRRQQQQLRQDVDTLRRLATEFQDTLATLGTDVDQLKRDLAALTDRVRAIEEEVRRMPKITGAANLAFLSQILESAGTFTGAAQLPTDIDSRPLDLKGNILTNIRPVYDIDLGITARLSDVATAKILLNAGNYLVAKNNPGSNSGYLNGSISTIHPFGDTGSFDVIPYYAYIDAPVSFGAFGASFTIGKFGQQFTPYTLKLIDVDSYLNIDKTDDGNYPILGGRVNFRVGGVNVQAYAGRHRDQRYADLTSTAGLGVLPIAGGPFLQLGQPLFVGNSATGIGPTINPVIDQSAGARVSLGTPFKGTLGLTYLEGAGSTDPTWKRLQVAGADLNFTPWKNIGLGLDYTQSKFKAKTGDESSRQKAKDKEAWDGRVRVPIGKLALTGFYRKVGPNFDAPGSWFTIGRWKNPRAVEGYGGTARYPLGNKLALDFEGASYSIIGARDNDVLHLRGGLRYALTSRNSVDFGYEEADYSGATGSSSTERYYNIGFGHSFNPNMSLKLLYQIIDFSAGAVDITPNQDYTGGVAVTQFTVRF
jgi:S-layer homology domain